MISKTLLISNTCEWFTPKWIVDKIKAWKPITLDPCYAEGCFTDPDAYCNAAQDGLKLNWDVGGLVYVNPPYGREIGRWVDKAIETSQSNPEVLLLLPARVDTKWFARIWKSKCIVVFLYGRLHFGDSVNAAPFPSCFVYFGEDIRGFLMVVKNIGTAVKRLVPEPVFDPWNP